MAKRTLKGRFVTKLYSALDLCHQFMRVYRQNRQYMLKQFVGKHYMGKTQEQPEMPMPMVENGVTTYTRLLVAQNPSVLVGARVPELRPFASTFELALNHLVRDEIDLRMTLRRAVVDAMFGVGIAKTGLGSAGMVEAGGFQHDVGQPFCDCVDLDDFVVDPSARVYEEVAWVGNKFRMRLEDAKAAFKNTDQLVGTYDAEPIRHGNERVDELSGHNWQRRSELVEYVELYEIWLPTENLILTLPCENQLQDRKPLRIVSWEGPETGPYDMLRFTEVPSNLMPLPPVAHWRELNRSINALARKFIRQAERQKSIGVADAGAGEDAESIRTAKDGDVIQVLDPNAVKELRINGVNNNDLAYLIYLMKEFNQRSGNIDLLGGLKASAPTLGQEQMLGAGANARTGDMQDCVYAFTRAIVNKLGFYLFYDPLIDLPLVKRVAGTNIQLQARFNAENREGDFLQYNMHIEPYSMQKRTPETIRQTYNEWALNQAIPLMQIGMQQGVIFDVEAFLRHSAKINGIAEVDDFLISERGGQGPFQTPEMVGKPPVTRREYVRHNTGGQMSPTDQLMNTMMQQPQAGQQQPLPQGNPVG